MKTSAIYLSFLFCLASVVLTSEEEERTFDLLAPFASLLGLGAAGLGGAAAAAAAGSALSGLSGLSGGKGGKGKGKDNGILSGLLGGKGGKDGKGKGKDGKGKGGKDGKGGKAKGGKGKRRSLIKAEQERQDLSTLLSLASLAGEKDGAGLGFLLQLLGGGNLASIGGKAGKASEQLFSFAGRSSKLLETERHGKGKDGKGKGKDGKGKGKGKDNTESTGSSLIDTLSNILPNFGILGQIIQGVLDLLTGAVSSLNPFKSVLETKTTTAPLPNPVTDPLGFIQSPLISAFLNAILSGDPSALMKPLGDLAGTLITQFIMNSISG